MKKTLSLFSLLISMYTFSQHVIWEGEIVVGSQSHQENMYKNNLVNGRLYFYTHDYWNTMTLIDVFADSETEVVIPDTIGQLSNIHPIEMDQDVKPEFLVRTDQGYYFLDDDASYIMKLDYAPLYSFVQIPSITYFENTVMGNILITSNGTSEKHTQVIASKPKIITAKEKVLKTVDSFIIVPNPAKDVIRIKGKIGENISLFTAEGVNIDNFTLKDTEQVYPIKHLVTGVYIIKKEGQSTEFIKQ